MDSASAYCLDSGAHRLIPACSSRRSIQRRSVVPYACSHCHGKRLYTAGPSVWNIASILRYRNASIKVNVNNVLWKSFHIRRPIKLYVDPITDTMHSSLNTVQGVFIFPFPRTVTKTRHLSDPYSCGVDSLWHCVCSPGFNLFPLCSNKPILFEPSMQANLRMNE